MRAIKFRAWDGERMLPHDSAGMGALVFNYLAEHDGKFPRDMKLMQYTGLKDKNSKEIYEGDVVKGLRKNKKGVIKEIVSPVVFHHGHYMIVKSKTNKKWRSLGDCENKDVLEVIGNIYENKELLK